MESDKAVTAAELISRNYSDGRTYTDADFTLVCGSCTTMQKADQARHHMDGADPVYDCNSCGKILGAVVPFGEGKFRWEKSKGTDVLLAYRF